MVEGRMHKLSQAYTLDVPKPSLEPQHRRSSRQVLWVIASGINDRIFDQKGARAIIQLAWREAEIWQIIAFALAP